MAKTPEDFRGKPEDKGLKTKILQLEKRFVETELAVNELKELIHKTNIESVPDLMERLESVEDLVMLENVGVSEVKKMLIALQESLKRKVPPEFEEKISKMEGRLANMEHSLEALPSPKEIMSPGHLAEMEKNVLNVNAQLEALREKVENIKPSISVKLLTKRMEEFRDELDRRMKDTEADLAIVKEKSTTFSVPETLAKELEETKNNFTINNARLEAVEDVMKSLATDIQAIKRGTKGAQHNEKLESMMQDYGKRLEEFAPIIKKMESFEKITNLKKDIENKLEEFRMVQEETGRLEKKVKSMYSGVDKKLDLLKDHEMKLPNIIESIDKLKKEMDKTKSELAVLVKQDDLADIIKRNVESFGDLENRLNALKGSMQESSAPLVNSIEKFDRRLNMLEEVQGDVMKRLESTKDMEKLDKRLEMLESTQAGVMKTVDGVMGKMGNMTKSLESTKIDVKVIDELQKRINDLKSEINKLGAEAQKVGAKKTVGEIMPVIEKRIAEIQEPTAVLSTQVADLLDRLVFLESRLGAIESEMQKKINVQPVILE